MFYEPWPEHFPSLLEFVVEEQMYSHFTLLHGCLQVHGTRPGNNKRKHVIAHKTGPLKKSQLLFT